MIGTYKYTDDVACDPQEGYDWQNDAIEGCDWYLPVYR